MLLWEVNSLWNVPDSQEDINRVSELIIGCLLGFHMLPCCHEDIMLSKDVLFKRYLTYFCIVHTSHRHTVSTSQRDVDYCGTYSYPAQGSGAYPPPFGQAWLCKE